MGRKRFIWVFGHLGGFIIPLNPNIVVLKTAEYINDVNLFQEPLIAVDRLLGGNWLRA